MPLVKHRKVVMLGYPNVGKTSLALNFLRGEFSSRYDPTFEDNWNKRLVIGEEEFDLDIVDTAGQGEFSMIPHSYVFGIHGYIVVYSVGCDKSFIIATVLHKYLEELRGKCRMPIVLVANKCDLPEQSRTVPYEEGKKLADSWGAAFMEVSAKNPEHTKQIFVKIIHEIDRVERSFSDEKKCGFM
uniref:Rheb n=1 Tax=Leptobrachium leishanense TaxID=445787 RepID=A0A8C5M4J4_9ANUR